MTHAAAFVERHLSRARPQSRDSWICQCPAHADDQPSLSIGTGQDGRVLLTCHRGCSLEDICQALDVVPADLFPKGPRGSQSVTLTERRSRVVAEYRYTLKDGTPSFLVVRLEPKAFRQHAADGRGGWLPKRGDAADVVFRLDRLQGQQSVVVVEGEKDVLAAERAGLVATCNAGGASTSPDRPKWKAHHTAQLIDAGITRATVIPDNDPAGFAHAHAVAASLVEAGVDVRWLELPGLPPKGDLSDALAAGLAPAELRTLVEAAQSYRPSRPLVFPAPAARVRDHRMDDGWPAPLGDAAYLGVLGEMTRVIEPETEADPVAVLVQLLVMAGNVIGRAAHFKVGPRRHFLNLFVGCVGRTSRGRKGTSLDAARDAFSQADPEWVRSCWSTGLSSGEGLIWAIRDQITRKNPVKEGGRVVRYEDVIEDHGVDDKRIVFVEPELASPIKRMARENNTLSAVLRTAFDGDTLDTRVKNSPARASDPHVSLIGHITKVELDRYLEETEMANGLGNRFLWVCVSRSKELPEGGAFVDLAPYVARLRDVIAFGRGLGELRRDDGARALWQRAYSRLTADRSGLFGSMTSRAEALVARLACIYAICDLSPTVGVRHLEAALALWEYAEASARYLFGQRVGDPLADAILEELRRATPEPLSRTTISASLGRNRKADAIERALGELLANGLAVRVPVESKGAGRAPELWALASPGHASTVSHTHAEEPHAVAF
jgi:hypothetical protein